MNEKATKWLWQNRKTLITVALFAAVLELLYFLPFYLIWWLILGAILLALGVWWQVGFSQDWQKWWPMPLEVWWLAAAGVGFSIFSIVGIWQYHLVVVALLIILFRVLMLYGQYWEEDSWPVRAFAFLNFLNLVAFFLASSVFLTMADFYSLHFWIIMIIFGFQVLLAIYLRFWREGGMTLRRWFYAVLTVLILEEVLWVLSSWHRGVFFKSFLIAIIFYALVDFIMHYTKGTLTVKVAVEYAFLILILLVAIFLFDWLFILQ
jgi:hypothetical protein